MVQCETCKVWQHGLCMGYESEDQLHDDDYYCEQCRPELHSDLLKYDSHSICYLCTELTAVSGKGLKDLVRHPQIHITVTTRRPLLHVYPVHIHPRHS